jgi:hypothetical protein
MTDPDGADSDTDGGTTESHTVDQQTAAACSTPADGNAAAKPVLLLSPLAPCVSLGSFRGQAWLKALLHGAAYSGEAVLLLSERSSPACGHSCLSCVNGKHGTYHANCITA